MAQLDGGEREDNKIPSYLGSIFHQGVFICNYISAHLVAIWYMELTQRSPLFNTETPYKKKASHKARLQYMNSSLTNFNSFVHVINPSFSTSKIPSLFPFISVTKKGGRVFTLCKINKTAKDMDPGDPKFFGEARALGAVTDRSEVVRGGAALMLLFPPRGREKRACLVEFNEDEWQCWMASSFIEVFGCVVPVCRDLCAGLEDIGVFYKASNSFGTYSAEMHINSTP